MIRKLLIGLLSAFILLILILYFLLATQLGLNTVISIAKHVLPGKLSVAIAQGQITRNLQIKDLHYRNDHLSVKLDSMDLRWAPLTLLTGRIHVNKLIINGIHIHTYGEQETTKNANNEPFELKLPIQFTLDDIQVYNLTFQQGLKAPTYMQSFNLSAHSFGKRIYIKNLYLISQPYTLQLKGITTLGGSLNTDLQGELINKVEHQQAININFSALGNNQKLVVKANTDSLFKAHFNAELYDISNHGKIAVNGEWQNVLWPTNNKNTFISPNGTLQVTGTLKNYQAILNTRVGGTQIPEANINLHAHGNWQQLTVDQLTIELLKGSIQATGKINWQPNLAWQFKLSGNHLNLDQQWPEFYSNLNFKAATTGSLKTNHSLMNFELSSLSGSLNNQSVNAHGTVIVHNQQTTVNQFTFAVGNNKLSANGIIGENSNFTWQARLTNLAQLIPNAKGNINTQGSLSGDINKFPKVQATLSAQQVIYNQLKISSLKANANINLNGYSSITINGNKIFTEKRQIHTISFIGKGTQASNTMNLNAQTNLGKAIISVHNSYQNKQWISTLNTFSLNSAQFGNWALNKPVTITYSKKQKSISAFCWRSQHGSICAQADYKNPKDWELKANLQQINLGLLQAFLPPMLKINTDIDATANFATNKEGEAIGQLNLLVNSADLAFKLDNKQPQIKLINSRLTTRLDKNGLQGQLILRDSRNLIPTQATFSLPNYHGNGLPKPETKVQAKILANWPSLSFISEFIPSDDVRIISGQLATNLTIAGTIATPKLSGYLKLLNGQVKLDKLGLNLSAIQLALAANNSNTVNINGQLASNGKLLKLNGMTTMANDFTPTQLNIAGTDVPIINNSQYKINVSPNLTLNYRSPNLYITGNIDIPYALLTPKDFTTTVSLPDSVQYADQETKKQLIQPHLKIKVTLGKNVKLKYSGLYAELGGDLNIDMSPNELTTATGQLSVTKGYYQAYGEHLDIKTGVLTYTGGSIANPGINILAIKTIKVNRLGTANAFDNNNISVGVQVSGNINRPKISLYSKPDMSNNDKLSYLLFGQPSTDVSGAKYSILSRAASSLGIFGQGEGSVTGNIKDKLGLTEFGVESNQVINPADNQSQQNSSFVVGKRISKHISVSYSVGILIPVNILSIRYQPFKNWALQTDTSNYGSGFDILYTFERN